MSFAKRIVVTGMGLVTPLGVGVGHNWTRLTGGESGIRAITDFPVDDLPSQIAGQVPRGSAAGQLDLAALPRQTTGRNDEFIIYGLVAAEEAIGQAGWAQPAEEQTVRTAVIVGSGIGGLKTLCTGTLDFQERGSHALSPYFIPAQLINLASGQIAMAHGYRGPNYSVVSACATGAEAIAAGARAILLDEVDVAVVGGADATIHPVPIAGFCRARAMSTGYNDRPSEASRPFDTGRDGFVIAEGAGVLVIEERDHAMRRGAQVIAELCSYASGSDAYHVTATHPDGIGEQQTLTQTLERAGINAGDVDYVNAHATSTPVGDAGELGALRAVFGKGGTLAISSTKSATGHTLGAAGAVEAIYSVLSIVHGEVPPTLNLHDPDENYRSMNLVPLEAQRRNVRYAISNAFGFGSTKATLLFGRA